MSTKTFLDGVNENLARLKINPSTQPLASFQYPKDQFTVDVAVQIWQSTVDAMYDKEEISRPNQMKETGITLIQDQREYALPDDLVTIRWPLQRTEKGFYIFHWINGYNDLINHMPQPDIWKGQPNYGVIKPTNNTLWLDRIPQAQEANWVYTLRYDREFRLEDPADEFPFQNLTVYYAMRDTVSELLRMDTEQQARPWLAPSFARAVRAARGSPENNVY